MEYEERTGPPLESDDEGTALDDKLKQELAEQKEKAQGYLASWQRTQADFTNYRRRCEQEKADTIKSANGGLILRLLPVVDDLERALAEIPEDSWADGIKLIYSKFKSILKAEGLEDIECEGKPFDPACHEVTMQEEGEEGIVVGTLEKGYKLQGKLLRPAKVVVGSGETE